MPPSAEPAAPSDAAADEPAIVSVVVPAYNEEATIRDVLEKVVAVDLSGLSRAARLEVIVVDDGSSDRTREIVRALADEHAAIRLVEHEVNRGKGAGIRTGLAAATGEIILVQDADLEYDPNDYPALLAPILDGRAKIVYGSRFRRRWWPTNMAFPNWLANRVLTWTTRLLYFRWITDEATCYKVFHREVFDRVTLTCSRFEFCPEVTAKAARAGYRFFEVPIFYEGRTGAEGKKITARDGFEALWTLVKYRFIS